MHELHYLQYMQQ